jgi:A/G-specific adenine glycosylase
MPAKLAKSNATASTNRVAQHSLPDPRDLLAWYDRHARRLPWRVGQRERAKGLRPEPYFVWLSEVMLQQTTVKAVGPYFLRFVERWPTIRDLAAADERDVMAAWAGLGYYSRARNLIACARAVAERPSARFPETAAELEKLPGIGGYTSAAIAAIAFGEPATVVDGNVERVIARLFAIETPLPAAKAEIRERLQPLVPDDRPGEFAEALMDLGATICTPKKPACSLCPWCGSCLARQQGRQEALPAKAAKRERPTRFGIAFVVRREDGAILLRRRPPKGLLGGMAEVPGGALTEAPSKHAEPPFPAAWSTLSQPVAHGFTHFELVLTVNRADVADCPPPCGCWWSPAASLPEEALPSLMKKVIEAAYPGATKPSRKIA